MPSVLKGPLTVLNKGLPIKIVRQGFEENDIFSMKKNSRFNPLIIRKSFFLIRRVPILRIWVGNSDYAIQHIGNRKRFTEVLLPPCEQTFSFAYKCSFIFQTSYKNGMIGHGGNAVKMLKITYYKNLLGTNFLQTFR